MADHHDLFISYSRSADGTLAELLQRDLELFAKPIFRRRALRVFRDDDELSANPALWTSIKNALDGSGRLLILACPASASSEWVGKEIHHWTTTKPSGSVLLALTDGTAEWDDASGDFDFERSTALPPSLRGAFTEEPRYVDLRWIKEQTQLDKKDPRLRSAVADLAAPLHGRSKDELVGDDLRNHKRLLRLTWTAVALLVVLMLSAVVAAVVAVDQRDEANAQRIEAAEQRDEAEAQRQEAEAQRKEAETQRDEADAQRLEASRQRDVAEVQRDEAERQALIAEVRELSARSLAAADPYESLAFGIQAELTSEPPRSEARDAYARAVQRVAALPLVPSGLPQAAHDSRGAALAFSTDSTLLISAAEDDIVRAWRADDRVKADELTVNGSVGAIEFAPDDNVAAIGDGAGALWLWRPISGEVATPIQIGPDPITAIAWNPGGERMAIGTLYGSVWLADVANGTTVGAVRLLASASSIVALGWVDGRIGYVEQSLQVGTIDPETGKELTSFAVDVVAHHEGAVMYARFSPDGSHVATLGDTGTPVVWDVMSGTQVGVPFPDSFGPITWSPDGRAFVSGAFDLRVHELDTLPESAFPPVPVHQAEVWASAWSPDARTVATLDADGSIRWWATRIGRHPLDYVAPGSLRWSSDGQRVMGVTDGVRSWDPTTATSVLGAGVPPGELSPDGSRVAVQDRNTLSIYDVAIGSNGSTVIAAPGIGGSISKVVWSGDGSKLAGQATHDASQTNPEQARIRVWTVGAGGALTETASLLIEDTGLMIAGFTPDGSTIVLHDSTGLSTWDLESEPVHVLDLDNAYEIAFAPDGQLAAVRGFDASLMVDTDSWTTRFVLPSGSVAWSPDGSVFAVADEQLGLYDATTAKQLGDPLDVPGWGTDSIAWSPDGTRLAVSGGLDPEVLLVADSWSESEGCALLADVFGDALASLIGEDRTSVCNGQVTDIVPQLPVDLRRFTTAEFGGELPQE